MPHGDEQLSGHCHEDFHLVLLADYRLMIGESTEEAVLGAACSPCALDDCLPQVDVAVSDAARLELPVGYIVARLQSAP